MVGCGVEKRRRKGGKKRRREEEKEERREGGKKRRKGEKEGKEIRKTDKGWRERGIEVKEDNRK